MNHDETYLQLCKYILENGVKKEDRTNTGTISIFGYQMKFNLQENFPLLTTKRIPFRLIVSELLWFIKGDTNIRYLLEHNNHIWNEWAFKKWVESPEYVGPDMKNFGVRIKDEQFKQQYNEQMNVFTEKILTDNAFAKKYGELGNVYGSQWRNWRKTTNETIDQLQDTIKMIKTNPDSRRLIVSAWNPEDVPTMALPPCHTLFQFYVTEGKLSCQLYQRSADVFLGVPFNIASYALLTHMIAHECGLQVGEFIHTLGDAHIYLNHLEQVNTQLLRESYKSPTLQLNEQVQSVFDFQVADITLHGYQAHKAIKAPIAV